MLLPVARPLPFFDRWLTSPPAEPPTCCCWCDAPIAAPAHYLGSAAAAHLGVRVGDVVCDEHAAMVREDLGGAAVSL